MIHPENSDELNEIIGFVEGQEIVDVWCEGCGMIRSMNKVYTRYIGYRIRECRFCRESNEGNAG